MGIKPLTTGQRNPKARTARIATSINPALDEAHTNIEEIMHNRKDLE
jgi:hypothetical protein